MIATAIWLMFSVAMSMEHGKDIVSTGQIVGIVASWALCILYDFRTWDR